MVTRHRSEPGERQRVPVDDRDQCAVCRHPVEQALDMAAGARQAAPSGAASRRPAGVQAVGRCHREETDVAAVFGHEARGSDSSGAIAPA